MLFLFLLGQGVWIYHVRELKVKEFKMRAGYLLSEVAEEYIADEGLKYLAYGRDSSFRNGRLRENKDEKCFPVNHFYVFSEDKIHLVYDDLYENRELDVRRLDSLLRNALTERQKVIKNFFHRFSVIGYQSGNRYLLIAFSSEELTV